MPYKQAIDYCKKIEAQKGRIAALEIWKSSKHYDERKERGRN